MRKIIIPTLSLFFFFLCGCRTYLIDKDSAAKQMTNLKIERRSGQYYTDLNYLITKNELLQNDTVIPFDIKFYVFIPIHTKCKWLD